MVRCSDECGVRIGGVVRCRSRVAIWCICVCTGVLDVVWVLFIVWRMC